MLAANSIEHACNFVKKSTARLLNVDTLSAVLPPNEFRQANASISQILSNAVEVNIFLLSFFSSALLFTFPL